jgi:predicted transcriptional regulator
MKADRYAFILVSDKDHWSKLLEKERNGNNMQVFIRKNRVAPKETSKLLFYVKKPVRQIRGVADFIERVTGDPLELWNRFGSESIFESVSEYSAFIEGREKATFVRFNNLKEFQQPISSEQLCEATGLTLTPRSGRYLTFDQTKQLTV